MVKVPQVDQKKCIGCGACVAICEKVFVLKAGKADVVDPTGASEEEIQKAIDACPAGAILWTEE